MNKILFKSILVVAVVIIKCSTVFADKIPYSVVFDYMNNTVTISGTVDDTAKHVALQVLAEGKTFNDLAENPSDSELVLHRYQQDISDGVFSFIIQYDDINANTYVAKLVTDGKEEATTFGIQLVNGDVYLPTIEELKSYANAQDFAKFKNCIESKNNELGFDLTLYKMLTDVDAMRPYMNYVRSVDLIPEQSNEIIKDFRSFVLMAALEEGKVKNINDYIKNASVGESQVAVDFLKLATTTEKQEYVTSKMSKKIFESTSDFEEALKEALILSEVRFASGYGGVQSILAKYGSVVGITGTASSDVYKAISGQSYADGKELLEAYKRFSATSGGSSKGSSSGSRMPTYMNATYPTEENSPIAPKKFENYYHDIDGVEWAVEAILALTDKKILNGKSEGFFKPDHFITREEFVKILVGAMGYQNEVYSVNVFSDVSDSDWFCSYVNIAYKCGLIQGIGDGKFGTGLFITRQDMMVMLYNAMKLRKLDMPIPTGTVVFKDSDLIADYAIDAVTTLYEMGIVHGISETEFDPLGNATRAQAAKVVYDFMRCLQ